MAEPRIISMSEVAEHNKPGDIWLTLYDRVYDVTAFFNEHPGGPDNLLSVVGKDATSAFESFGHSEAAYDILEKYYIGDLDLGDTMTEGDKQTVQECDKILDEVGHSEASYEACRRIKAHVQGEAGWFHLNLGNLELKDDGAAVVARVLKHSPLQVQKVMMEGNNIGSKGAQSVADMLRSNRAIICIILQCNEISDDGAKALAEACEDNATLEVLGVHTNFITDEGGVALGHMLGVNRHLRVLSANHNAMGDATAEAMAEGLAQNKYLEGLSFSFNCVTNAGACAFARALSKNAKLRHLWLNGNPIGQMGFEALNGALRENKTLEQVRLTLNGYELYKDMVDSSVGQGFQGIGSGPHRTSLEFKKNQPYVPKGPGALGVPNTEVRGSVEAVSGFFSGTGRKPAPRADTRGSVETVRMSTETASGRPTPAERPSLTAVREDEVEVNIAGAEGKGGGARKSSESSVVMQPHDSRIWQLHTWPEEAGGGVKRAAQTTGRASDVGALGGRKASFRSSIEGRRASSRGTSLDVERVQRDPRMFIDWGQAPPEPVK